ncbi:MAG: hypothetical protein AVDCRST_MAG73-3543 [uncultured Thermomicrobiales bacterium]|uniref:Rhodanese domain-containing protein n=1 Tax=uncultured Thermomicrobiales bacterium TaxID=1645740 RepID=A0A6J4UXS5_9BACT|nr:MAG: hypothetical protein AVDCRST_MAG73-3543 [uncultured Thermomicrobiales bacterium]
MPPGWLKDPDDEVHVTGPKPFAALMTAQGVSNGTTVVTYDDGNGTAATRLWWILSYCGHADVRVLNGGWRLWLDQRRLVTFRDTFPPQGGFLPRPREAMRVRLAELRERHTDPGVRVVNVIWPEMLAGTDNPFGNKRVGHISGSVNLPIERYFVDEEVPVLKPAPALRATLAESGVTPDRETIGYCQARVRSTTAIFAAALLGWDNARGYAASLAEWANRDDSPLATATG